MGAGLQEPLLGPSVAPAWLENAPSLFVGAATSGNAEFMATIHEAVREAGLSEAAFYADAEAFFHLSMPDASDVPLLASFLRLEGEAALPVLVQLLAFKPNLDAPVGQGQGNVTFYASATGRADAVSLLLRAGASPHTKSGRQGQTPLHGAAQGGHLDVVELLVRHGASLLVETNEGFTAAALAQRGGHVAVANFIHARGGFPTMQPPAQRPKPVRAAPARAGAVRGFPAPQYTMPQYTMPSPPTRVVVVERQVIIRETAREPASECPCCCRACCDIKCCDTCCSFKLCESCCSAKCCDSCCSCRICKTCCFCCPG